VGVIDIDSTVPGAFDDDDKNALESLARILGEACDW
jgi:L-methionine (R)-S-oxide reductase